MVKKLIITSALVASVAFGLSACQRGPDPVKARCMAAVASVQKFRSFPAQNLVNALNASSFNNLPTAFSYGAIPSGNRGTLVIETRSPAGSTKARQMNDPVMNIYCL